MKKIKFLFAFIGLISLLVVPTLAFAQISTEDLGLGYGTAIGLTTQDVRVTIANIIRVALGLLGIVAVVIILWAGMLWMLSKGDDTKIGEAKKMMIQGVIGLVIILAAFAIATFVVNSLVEATGGTVEPL